jgi:hypothetical protein
MFTVTKREAGAKLMKLMMPRAVLRRGDAIRRVTFVNSPVSVVTFGRLRRAKVGRGEIGCGYIRKLKARKGRCRTAQIADAIDAKELRCP